MKKDRNSELERAYRENKKGPESLNVAIATAILCSEFRRRVF